MAADVPSEPRSGDSPYERQTVHEKAMPVTISVIE
jgi:hypothetical protein